MFIYWGLYALFLKLIFYIKILQYTYLWDQNTTLIEMKSTCKRKFMNQLTRIRQKPENQSSNQAILIVDEKGTEILKLVASVQQLLDKGIKNFTKINLIKKPQPNAIGIYFIGQQSIKLIQKDFQKKPIYFSINIVVCQAISQETMKYIANSQKIMERLATLQQFHIPVEYYGQKIAILPNSDGYLKSIYQQIDHISDEVGQNLFETIGASFNNLECLDLYYSQQSKFGANIAKKVHKLFKQFNTNQLQQQNQMEAKKNSKKLQQQTDYLQVIIFDRRIDMVSPMVRNFYYFPMIADMFNIKDFRSLKIQNLNKQTSSVQIQNDNKIFLQYKNKHISDAFSEIGKDLQRFTSQNKAARFQKQKQTVANNKNLKQVIKQFPQYTKTVKDYQTHIQIMKEIGIRSKREKMSQLGELEHLIITSLTSQAEAQKDKKIYKKAIETLSTINDVQIKARVIFLMLQCLQINQKQKQDLLAFYEKTPGYQAFSLLFQRPQTGKLRYNPLFKKQSIFLDRHQCIIAKRIQQILLDKPAKQMKKIQVQINSNGNLSKFKRLQKKEKKKLLIVMIGGISVNQISNIERIVQRLDSHEAYFLTDQITTPRIYLNNLKQLFRTKK